MGRSADQLALDVRLAEGDPRRSQLERSVREALAGQGRWQVTIQPEDGLLAIALTAEDGSRWAARAPADQEPDAIADLVRSACRRRSQRKAGYGREPSAPDAATDRGGGRRSAR